MEVPKPIPVVLIKGDRSVDSFAHSNEWVDMPHFYLGHWQLMKLPKHHCHLRSGSVPVRGEFFPEGDRLSVHFNRLRHSEWTDRRHAVLCEPGCDAYLALCRRSLP